MEADRTEENKNVVEIKDHRKFSLRLKAIRMMDMIIAQMYSTPMLAVLDQQGYATDKESIETAMKATKMNLMRRHLDGVETKKLSGVISELKNILIQVRGNNRVLILGNLPPQEGEQVEKNPEETF